MILQVCTIYDKRAVNYGPPMCFQTLGIAERSFGDSVNDPNNIMYKHPDDFSLMHIGTFDTDTGTMKNEHGRILCEAAQLKQNLTNN